MFPFATEAFAQTATGGGMNQQLIGIMPFVLIFIIFYFLIIRPQSKKQKEHQKMLDGLKKGDRVVTNGGLYGTVVSVADAVATLEIAHHVRVDVALNHIQTLVSAGKESKEAKESK